MEKYRIATQNGFKHLFISFFLLCIPLSGLTQSTPIDSEPTVDKLTAENLTESQINDVTTTLDTLSSFIKVRDELLHDIKVLNKQIDSAKSETEKNNLKQELEKLQSDRRATVRNIENIVASVDISRLDKEQENEFRFQKEVSSRDGRFIASDEKKHRKVKQYIL